MTQKVGYLVLFSLSAAVSLNAGAKPMERGKAWTRMREVMVAEQIAARGVRDPEVLRAMRTVPRHEFVPERVRDLSYSDHPLPIGEGQTISQPYIVAKMTELVAVKKGDRVLEIGTGSGYQAAVLAELGTEVFSIEILEGLSKNAKRDLDRAGYGNVRLRVGDGYKGWPEEQPFDAVVVTAAPHEVPSPLKEQLKVGGRLVIPVGGSGFQQLKVITRTKDGFEERSVFPVTFVPMTGKAQESSR